MTINVIHRQIATLAEVRQSIEVTNQANSENQYDSALSTLDSSLQVTNRNFESKHGRDRKRELYRYLLTQARRATSRVVRSSKIAQRISSGRTRRSPKASALRSPDTSIGLASELEICVNVKRCSREMGGNINRD